MSSPSVPSPTEPLIAVAGLLAALAGAQLKS